MNSWGALSAAVSVVVTLSLLSVLVAVWLDFKHYGKQKNTCRQKRSAVATGTMLLFFGVYYLVLRLNLGLYLPSRQALRFAMIFLGLALVVFGAVCNIWGRVVLKQNWANHIKIYEGHTLVTGGPFRYVRHPLYSSLFLMFYGGCLIYSNWLGAVLVSAVFVPMMNYRAGQEEALLLQTFSQYGAYKQKAGRFLPKTLSGYQKREE